MTMMIILSAKYRTNAKWVMGLSIAEYFGEKWSQYKGQHCSTSSTMVMFYITVTTGGGEGTQTCGMDNVFPPDDL